VNTTERNILMEAVIVVIGVLYLSVIIPMALR
jgi:hypothetical protein